MKRLLTILTAGLSLTIISANAQTTTIPDGTTVSGTEVEVRDGETLIVDGKIKDSPEDGVDIETTGSSEATVTVNGTITDSADDGIDVDSEGSSTVVINIGETGTIKDTTGEHGIDIDADDTSTVTVNNDGTITDSDSAGVDVGNADDNSTVIINNSGTIKNTGDQGIDIDNAEENSSVTINNSGTIKDTDDEGIRVDDADDNSTVTINNSGTIKDTGDQGIKVDADNNSTVTINNSGTIKDTDDEGILIDAADNNSTVTISNSGTIKDTGDQGIRVNADDDSTVSVDNSGKITDTDDEGISVDADNNSTVMISNSGTIKDTGDEGIRLDANDSATGTVMNSGTIASSGDHGIIGAANGDSSVTIINSGTIKDSQDAGIRGSTGSLGATGQLTIENSGKINDSGLSGTNSGIGVTTGGLAFSRVSINNSGIINDSSGSGIGVLTGAAAITVLDIVNTGEIKNSGQSGIGVIPVGVDTIRINNAGLINNSSDFGIAVIGTAPATVQNSGIIKNSGSGAIRLSGLDDTLTIQGRSEIEGLIDGQGDLFGDTLNIIGRGLTPADIASITDPGFDPDGGDTFTFHGNTHNVVDWEILNITIEQYASLLPEHLKEFGHFLDNLSPTPDFLREVMNFLDLLPSGDGLNHAVSNLAGLDGIEQFKRESFQWGPDLSRSLGQYFHNLRQGGTGWDTSQVSLYDPNLPLAMQPYANKRLFAGTSMVDGHTDPVVMAKVIEDADNPPTDWGGFVQIQGTYSEQDASKNYSEADATSVRINVGADKRVTDNLAVGGMIGYSRTDANVDGLDSEVIDNSVNVGLYTHYSEGNSFVEGMIGYRAHFYEYDRNIIAAPGASANSDTVGHQLPASIRVGHDFKFGEDREWTFTPQAALHYSLLYMDGYSESGAGALNLIVDDFSAQSLQSEFGFRLAKRYTGTYGWVSPSLYASYNHEFLDENTSVSSRFSGGLTPFRVATADPERDFAVLGIALDGTPADYPCLHFGIRYDVQVGQEDYISHSATAHMRVDL
jgi:uncharacterized protein YhjY with autotransporter beta-barrel domain